MASHIIFTAIVCASVCAPAEVKVWDGDTVWVAGEKHRLAGFDTPEYADKARCTAENDLAVKARRRVADLLQTHRFSVRRTGESSYGRPVAVFTLEDGRTPDKSWWRKSWPSQSASMISGART